MKKLKNLLKKIIPILIFTACSPAPEPIDKLKKYTLENKSIYDSFKKLMENKKYLASEDGISRAFIDYERYCVYLIKKDAIDKNFKITFIDYGIDGLTKDDEYSDYATKFLKESNPEAQLNLAKMYTTEIKKLIKENKK